MDISYGTLRLSPRQQPTVSASDARAGSAAERGARPTLDTQPFDKPQMLRQALPASEAHQAALSAGQPAWLAKGATSLQQSALHKASEVNAERLDAAVTLHIAARAQQDEGRPEEAHKGYLEALSLYQSVLGDEHAYIAIGHIDIGWLLSAQGKHKAALESFRKALAIEEKASEPDQRYIALVRNAISDLLRTLGEESGSVNNAVPIQEKSKQEEALDNLRTVLIVKEREFGPGHVSTVTTYLDIASLLQEQGKHEEAVGYYLKALAAKEQILAVETDATALAAGYLDAAKLSCKVGLLLREQGKPEQAVEYLRKALAGATAAGSGPEVLTYQGHIDALNRNDPRS